MSSDRPHESDPLAPHRGRLLGLAYRMLGSRSDADDVVQHAYIRFAGAHDIRNPEAFLVTVVTRLCLDRLKGAKAQREIYVGPWLPEPVFDAEGLAADAATELADDLSFALLLALDRLSPLTTSSTCRSQRLPGCLTGPRPPAGNWRRGPDARCGMRARRRPRHRTITPGS
jgi:RNA polymerase sigma-70 factor (ECF subfamily)